MMNLSCDTGLHPIVCCLTCLLYVIVQCDVGYYLAAYDDQSCSPCPVGTYQMFTGKTSCTACPVGSTTLDTGSDHSTMCSIRVEISGARKRRSLPEGEKENDKDDEEDDEEDTEDDKEDAEDDKEEAEAEKRYELWIEAGDNDDNLSIEEIEEVLSAFQ